VALCLALCAACANSVVEADPAPMPTALPGVQVTVLAPITPTRPAPSATLAPTQPPTPASLPTATDQPPSPTAVPSPTQVPEITLIFAGDINPGRCVYAYAKAADDMALPFRPLAPILQAADIAIGSLDGTLSDHNPVPPCEETHRNLMGPSEFTQGLQFAGFDVITLATNHAKDCGIPRGCRNESLLDTIDNLRAAGILPTGAGANLAEAVAPAIVTVHGIRFAFLGFSGINAQLWAEEDWPGTGPYRREIYVEAIQRARQQADVVVVLPHWGREYSQVITAQQFQAAGEMVEAGASLVVGNHPHRVQGVETFPNGAVVAYALGNFAFDQTWSDGTLFTIQGIMLKATFRGLELQEIELLPIRIYDDFQPRLAEADEAAMILQDVEDSMRTAPRR
jgi:poly-gamma-glutamate capsule biosynthesis protein CapA/YwtB (metallophosphatase superfamily)